MKKMTIALLFAVVFIFLAIMDYTYAQSSRTCGSPVWVPIPRLIKPTSEVINIKDKDGILFKWSSKETPSGGRRGYRFQLYEGYDMYEKGLIFKKELDPHTFEIFVSGDKFKNKEVYTWSIRQRGHSSSWGKRGLYSFKVIK